MADTERRIYRTTRGWTGERRVGSRTSGTDGCTSWLEAWLRSTLLNFWIGEWRGRRWIKRRQRMARGGDDR